MAKNKSSITSAPIPTPPQNAKIMHASDAKKFGELQKFAKDELDLKVGYSLHGIDFDTVKDAVGVLETVITEFPQAKGVFKWLAAAAKGSNTLASASFSGGIDVNSAQYADIKQLEKTYADSVKSKFHPAGTTTKDIVSHEAGHILEKALIEKKYGSSPVSVFDKIVAWNKCELAKDIISKACKEVKNTPGGKGLINAKLIAQVSGYAKKNKSECLAECVADYMANKQNAKPLSIAVWNQLKKELG